jgi:hypothetical protein
MDNNETMMHKESVEGGAIVSQKIPKVQIEILIGGKQEEKDKVGAFLDELNVQINSYKEAKKRIRVLYHLRPDTMSEDEQNEWLKDKAHSIYMIFAPKDRSISSVYIKTIVNNIKKFEEGLTWMKERGVLIKKTPENLKQATPQVKERPVIKETKSAKTKAAK